MTPAQMRIAIAEICGWHDFQWQDPRDEELPLLVKGPDDKLYSGRAIPDYPNSLDAMWLAEETLKDENHQHRYAHMLRDVYDDSLVRLYGSVHAPAHVRAKVFLDLHALLKHEAGAVIGRDFTAARRKAEATAGGCKKCGKPTFGLLCAKCKGEK